MFLATKAYSSKNQKGNSELTPYGTQAFYQTDNNHFPKSLLLEHKTIYSWFHNNTMSGFKDIFGDTRVPIALKGKTHIFGYIAKKNEISFFSAIYALIRFF